VRHALLEREVVALGPVQRISFGRNLWEKTEWVSTLTYKYEFLILPLK
jgi:hypothetical protein